MRPWRWNGESGQHEKFWNRAQRVAGLGQRARHRLAGDGFVGTAQLSRSGTGGEAARSSTILPGDLAAGGLAHRRRDGRYQGVAVKEGVAKVGRHMGQVPPWW